MVPSFPPVPESKQQFLRTIAYDLFAEILKERTLMVQAFLKGHPKRIFEN